MSSDPLILVGHDGSTFADEALRWALVQAARTSGRVRVLRAWSITTAPRPDSAEAGYVPPLDDFAAAVLTRLESDTAATRAEHPTVDVDLETVHGPAAPALIEASGDADLLVVGPRGLGGFRGLVLGSVSEQCVRHAHCPVVVIRA
ncbi:universal stress family protein [Aeromicrobium marinum DSM 15272]|uniref:Universal stress family protein n=1 Tax=Aeromicrobium marinum DSM 15272 TaxID=585531 RepID=E2SD75_9ACTN|nr:universal stress protein [Aeromicrobium marinum]EFQ83178.1 universal stress family protein [Aeromicrobium marinum DSM 15272]